MKNVRTASLSLLAAVSTLAGCRFHGVESDGSGTIECTQVRLAPLVGGRVLRLPPQEGACVRHGDLAAQLDPADGLLRRDEFRALLAQAEAQLDLVRAGARAEDVQRGRDQVREAQVMAAAAAVDLRRTQALRAQDSATAKQLDDAQALADRTAATQAAAEQNLARLEAGSRKEELRLAEAQAGVARARLAEAEKAVQDCTLLSPVDGCVTTRSHEEGDLVSAGTTLLTLSRLDEVWLSIYVAETRLGRVKLGQAAQVALDGMTNRFKGRVTFISPEAEFTPKDVQTPEQRAKLVYRVKITLPNPDGVFKPGMPADAYLDTP